MKKILALLISVFMLSGVIYVPGFAADASAYVEDADMEGVAYTLGEGSWITRYATGTDSATGTVYTDESLAATAMGNSASNFNVGSSVSAAVYKLPLPEIPEGKEIDTAEFRMTSWYNPAREMRYAYMMPGNHDMDTITIGDMKKFIDVSSLGSGTYFIGGPITGVEYYNTTNYRNRYTVTDYINQCIANGQDYVWIAVTRNNTIKAYRHDVKGCEAKLFYTLRDAMGFSATGSSIEDGATEVYPKGMATITYSGVVSSAVATINDAAVDAKDITISGNTVNINFDLGLSENVTLLVTAKNAEGSEDIYEVTFTTDSKYKYYDDSDMEGIDYILADGSWILSYDPAATDTSALAATEMATSAANYNVGNKKNAAVYRVPLPEVPEGKELDMAEFRMMSYYSNTQARVMPYAYKMPGDEWNMTTITVADAQKLIDGNNLGSGDNHLATIAYDASYANPADYRNKYTVSDYVAEALVKGQDYVWIAVTYSGTIKAYRHGYTDKEAKLYYTFKDAGVFSVESQTPEEGATGVYPIGKATVAFSNMVASATATINGEAVAAENIEISGKTVNVSFNLGLDAQTALVVSATDGNGQTLSHTINFTTDSKYKFYDDSDMAGIEYTQGEGSWVMNYNPAAEDTTALAATAISSGSNVNVGNAINAAVYKMKLPVVPEGKRIKTAQLRVSAWYKSQRFMTDVFRMPGEDWDMSTITIADARDIIDGNNLGSGSNFITACSSDASYFDGVSSNRCKYDVTDYIAQCINDGQEYVYLAVTHGYTIKAYAHDSGINGAKLYYTLEDIPEEELTIRQPKIVDASSDAEYNMISDTTPAIGKDIKAIALMTNTTANDVNFSVAVAQYNGNKLVSVSFVPYTLKAGTNNKTVELGSVSVEADTTKVKAFIWNPNLSDVTSAKVINVK
ncbi:MAG: hypothetical protein IJB70_01300 [Clostridia bacterium]|nr:hypothetical protein [Clostridia bacterium]